MYEGRSTTNSWVMVFSVKPTNGPEKIIHISHCCRLYKLATFIFHIYKEIIDSDFEFSYFESKTTSYGGYFSFKLKHGDISLPKGIGNMRHARIDSAFFFGDSRKMRLRIENNTQEYAIKDLQTIPPTKGRKYPFVETSNRPKCEFFLMMRET